MQLDTVYSEWTENGTEQLNVWRCSIMSLFTNHQVCVFEYWIQWVDWLVGWFELKNETELFLSRIAV